MAAFSTQLIEYHVDADDGYAWDVAFNLGMTATAVNVTINVKLEGPDPGGLALTWLSGVETHWNNKGYFSDGTTLYKINFDFNYVTSGEHQVVQVHSGEGNFDMNNWYLISEGWPQSYQDETAAHEVGHMFGLPDEYDGGGTFDHYVTTGTLMSDLTVMDNQTTAGYENYFFSIQHYVEVYGFNESNPNVDILDLVLATLGTAGNNTLTGTAGMDALLGLAGDDVLSGLGGNDRLEGGAGNDTLNGGPGANFMDGGAGNDVYRVIARDRVIEAAGGGTDTVNTTTSYVLTAGSAVETVRAANPTANVTMNFTGNALAQFIQGNAGSNVINGGGAADVMRGLGGNDKIYGQHGNDTIDGGPGSDIIGGGAGNDTMTGGAANDIFIFRAGYGQDRITDFQGGTGLFDQIDMRGLFSSFSECLAASQQVGADLVITVNPSTILTIEDFYRGNFAADDIII